MKISTETGSLCRRMSYKEAIEMIAKAGFDAFDFSITSVGRLVKQTMTVEPNDHPIWGKDYLKFAREIKKIGDDCGIVCNQIHAPCPANYPQFEPLFEKSIEMTAELGAQHCIIHHCTAENPYENTIRIFDKLLPVAKSCNVKIAMENVSITDSFLPYFEHYDDPFLVACLDTGHAERPSTAPKSLEVINTLGNRVEALHLQDNDLINDSHMLPYTMQIDFPSIIKALKETGYKGYFTLEAVNYFAKAEDDKIFEYLVNAAKVARKMADEFEQY